MIGPEGAADRVVGWLATAIPARLRLAEARLGLDPATLPDPALVLAHEAGPIGLEDWPAVYALPQRLERMVPIEHARDDGGESYRCTYSVRVLAWVRADDYEATDELRKRYVLAIREALLDRKQLAALTPWGQPEVEAVEFTVDPVSLRESYSDVMADDANRTIAGAWLDVNVNVVEVLAGPAPLGTATTAGVAEQPLTAHPAEQ